MFPIFIRLVDELLWTMHTMWPRGFPQTWKLLRKIWKQASIKATQCGKTNMENGIRNELWTCSSQPNIIFALWKVLFSLKFWRKVDSKMKASFDIWIRYDPWFRIPTAKNSSNHCDVFRFCLFEETKIHQSVSGSSCILALSSGKLAIMCDSTSAATSHYSHNWVIKQCKYKDDYYQYSFMMLFRILSLKREEYVAHLWILSQENRRSKKNGKQLWYLPFTPSKMAIVFIIHFENKRA